MIGICNTHDSKYVALSENQFRKMCNCEPTSVSISRFVVVCLSSANRCFPGGQGKQFNIKNELD